MNLYAKEAGFNSSVQLIDILKRKKNISDGALRKLISLVELDNSEKIYLHALVAKSQSRSKEKEVMYDLLLNDLKPDDKNCIVYRIKNVDLFSHYIYMTILSMSELHSFVPEVNYIKEKLIFDVDDSLIDSALEILFHHKLLELDKNGEVIKPYKIVSGKTDHRIEKVEVYYSMVLDLAKKAIPLTPEEREFQCFSLPIAKDKLSLAKEIIRKCRANLDKLVDKNDKDAVYQVNLMMFPLTNQESFKE